MPDFVDRQISNKREKKMVDSNVTTQAESNQVVKAAIHNLKAARADDAEVPKWMWNDRIDNLLKGRVERTILDKALEIIREKFGHRIWVRRVVESFWSWRRGDSKHALEIASLEGGMDAMRQATCSSWWEWDQGSRIHFWRWPEEYLETARDGVKTRFKSVPPHWVVPQKTPSDERKAKLMKGKIQKVLDRGYIGPGRVTSLMNVFDVPKGEDDIRLVYDGTKSKLNDNLFAPWFPLPTIDSLLRSIDETTWCGDNDIGEQFHNFSLHPSLQPYCGIDLTELFPEKVKIGQVVHWERWKCTPMGIKPSPYQAVQGMIWWEEAVRGNRSNTKNPLRWATIVMNLPGSANYIPSKPWVYKARLDGSIAADFRAYVDDLQATGSSKEDCWQVTRLIGSKASEAGIQDASRKRREVSQSSGAWAGSVLETDGMVVGIKISQERWDKTKRVLQWIQSNLDTNPDGIPFKTLESYRGFLVYVSRTYPASVPYLKGIHLTLDSWRNRRDEDGWAIARWVQTVLEIKETLPVEGGCTCPGESSYSASRRCPGFNSSLLRRNASTANC